METKPKVCSTCKSWRRGASFEHGPEGPVLKTADSSRMGLCLNPAIACDYVNDWMNRGPCIERADGLMCASIDGRAVLETGENFSCIHYEQNP